MDMNPFANNNQQAMGGTPDYLKQNPRANASMPGAVSNMVKAIMEGNNKFQQRGGMGGSPGGAIPGASGPTSFGGGAGPMPLAGGGAGPGMSAGPMAPAMAPTSPDIAAATSGSTGPTSPAMSSFEGGAAPVPFGSAPGIMAGNNNIAGFPGMPNGPDKSMSALFSQIPGMGGGGFFGG
jgi:hypothetical protein